MTLQLMKLKIHRASVTDANVNYEGSITINRALMDTVGMHPCERVLCGNMANGDRFETYAIAGEAIVAPSSSIELPRISAKRAIC